MEGYGRGGEPGRKVGRRVGRRCTGGERRGGMKRDQTRTQSPLIYSFSHWNMGRRSMRTKHRELTTYRIPLSFKLQCNLQFWPLFEEKIKREEPNTNGAKFSTNHWLAFEMLIRSHMHGRLKSNRKKLRIVMQSYNTILQYKYTNLVIFPWFHEVTFHIWVEVSCKSGYAGFGM